MAITLRTAVNFEKRLTRDKPFVVCPCILFDNKTNEEYASNILEVRLNLMSCNVVIENEEQKSTMDFKEFRNLTERRNVFFTAYMNKACLATDITFFDSEPNRNFSTGDENNE